MYKKEETKPTTCCCICNSEAEQEEFPKYPLEE